MVAINEKDSRTMSATRAEKYIIEQKGNFLRICSAVSNPLIRKADCI